MSQPKRNRKTTSKPRKNAGSSTNRGRRPSPRRQTNRPAGAPRQRRRPTRQQFWVRRLVALAILIALLAGGVYVWMWAKGKLAEDAQKAAAKAKSQAQVYMPKDCQLKNLEIRVSPEQTVYQVGSEVGLQMSVKNTGETPCIADGSFAKVGVHIKSGDQDTYFSLPCNKDLPKKTLLLDKNQTWQKTLAWDGSTADKKCAATGSAQAGTYKLIPVFGNKEFPGEQSIVTFEGAPAPQSQETPQGQ